MTTCPRCTRHHAGVCGIPRNIALGRGTAARPSLGRAADSGEFGVARYKSARKPGENSVLERLRALASERLQQVGAELRKHPDADTELLDEEAHLYHLLRQTEGQIAGQRGKG